MRFSESFQSQYDVKSMLGEGGMGRVMLAEDRQLKRPVAIKFLADFDDGPEGMIRQRFEEEARVCAGFKHPNIVRMFTSGFEGGKPFMVFEFIDGQDVGKRLEAKGTIDVEEALSIAAATLAGLHYAHEYKVIHRDVKPGNIILRADGGEPMLMDFGVAKAQTGRTFKTQTNLILGTPLYMAPELIRREEMGPGVDVYALGCTLYECLTGKPPYMAKSDVMVLEMHLTAKPEPLRSLKPELPEDVELLIERAMEKDPEKRFRTAQDMAGWVDTIRTGGRVPRARTVPQMPAPAAGVTRPELVAPTSRPPRVQSSATRPMVTGTRPGGAGSRPGPAGSKPGLVGSRTGSDRVSPPGSRTRVATRAPDGPPETPSMITRKKRRSSLVAAGALLVGAVAFFGWRHAGALPSEVRLAFSPDGLDVSWRTSHALRGAVFHRVMEGSATANPDGTLDHPPAHDKMTRSDEAQEATTHHVPVPKLRPGDRIVVSIAGPAGVSAWARTVLVPPAHEARQQPPETGATMSRVLAQTGRVLSAKLETVNARGEQLTLGPSVPDVAQLTFEVPVSPDQLAESTRVRAEQLPGVTIELPVVTMGRFATRLLEAMEHGMPSRIVAELVNDASYDINVDFDNMLGETPMFDMPKSVARRRSPERYFRGRVQRLLDQQGVWQPLEEFRPFADAWFSSAHVSDELKVRMYTELLKLENLDGLIRGQHDDGNQLGIARYYEALVQSSCTLARTEEAIVPPPEDALIITPGGYGWVTEDHRDWKNLASWCRDVPMFRGFVSSQIPDVKEAPAQFQWRRTFPVRLPPGASAAGTAQLHAKICVLGPNFYFDVVIPGRSPPFKLRIAQPATPEWRKVMDDAASSQKVPPHGQVTVMFPARFLPPSAEMKVEIQYHHLPGVRADQLNRLPRACLTRDFALSTK